TVTGFAETPDGDGDILLVSGPVALTDQVGVSASVAVTDWLQVTGAFDRQTDRIIRRDGLPWAGLGFAVGQQVFMTGVAGTHTITGFDTSAYGPGSALLLGGPALPPATNVAATVAVTSRNQLAGNLVLSNPDPDTGAVTRTGGTWADAGFAVDQLVAIPG